MNRRLLVLGAVLAAFVMVAFPRLARAQVSLAAPTYPLHDGTTRVPLAIDPNSTNVGINRADCVADLSWTWAINVNGISFDHLDIYAKADNTSCADLVARTTTKTCFKVGSLVEKDVKLGQRFNTKLRAIIQAARLEDVDPTMELNVPVEKCDIAGSMKPTTVYLHFVPMDGGGTPIGGTSANDMSFQTAWDIGGPAPPSSLTLTGGSQLVTAHWPTGGTGSVESDFVKWRAYYYTDDSAPVPTVKGIDGGDETDTDPGDADAAVASDSATDVTVDSAPASTTEACPSGVPFVAGLPPTPAVLALPHVDGTSLNGKMTIDGLTNHKRYAVAIAAVDKYENSGALSNYDCFMPRETNDFYTVYQGAGGQAGGGFCAIGAPGATPIAVLFLAVTALGLVARRFRRGAR